MTSLPLVLTDPARRPQAVEALASVVESEVRDRSGISGVALKTAFKAVTAIKSDIVFKAVDYMLPDFADALDPFWAARGGQPFGAYLSGRGAEAADALLNVTDKRANKPEHATIAKIYNSLRPKAQGMVEAALPRLGAAVESLAHPS